MFSRTDGDRSIDCDLIDHDRFGQRSITHPQLHDSLRSLLHVNARCSPRFVRCQTCLSVAQLTHAHMTCNPINISHQSGLAIFRDDQHTLRPTRGLTEVMSSLWGCQMSMMTL